MDEDYLLTCARYVGLNPVRAGLCARAVDWPWSSVRAHLEGRSDLLLTAQPLKARLGASLAGFFELDVEDEARRRLRRASTTGRPLGAAAWVKALEATIGRSLSAPAMGRPPGPRFEPAPQGRRERTRTPKSYVSPPTPLTAALRHLLRRLKSASLET